MEEEKMLRQLAVSSPQAAAPPNTPARSQSGLSEMKPVDPQILSVMITQVNLFYGSFRKAEVDDPDTFTAGCLRLFTAYPLQAVRFVIDPVTGLPGRSEWLPSLKAVRDALEAFQDERRRQAQVAARAEAQEQQVAARREWLRQKPERPTLEELRARYGENWGLARATRRDDGEARARRREALAHANRRAFAAECERAGMPADSAVSPSLMRVIRGES